MALQTPFYDEVHAYTFGSPKDHGLPREAEHDLLQYRMLIRKAHRFVLNDEMIDLVTQASLRLDKVPLWTILARLPFDACWFELDHHVRMRSLQANNALQGQFDPEESSRKMGWLMVRDEPHPTRWVAFEFITTPTADHGERVCPSIVAYVLDPEGAEGMPAVGVTGNVFKIPALTDEIPALPPGIQHVLWGLHDRNGEVFAPEWSRNTLNAVLEPTFRRRYLASRRAEHDTRRTDSLIQMHMMEARGVMRFMVSFLAAINDVPMLYREVEPRTGFTKTRFKKVEFLSHTEVRIKAPKTKPFEWLIRKLDAAGEARSGKKRHDVRGHWRTLIDPKTKMVQGRTWIKEHQRGDASLGYVKHTYTVEPGT